MQPHVTTVVSPGPQLFGHVGETGNWNAPKGSDHCCFKEVWGIRKTQEDQGSVQRAQSCAKTSSDSAALSSSLVAVCPFRSLLVDGQLEFDPQSHRVTSLVHPLLSQLSELTDASWWLLDSGASTSVLAESNLTAFGTQVTSEHMMDRYSAANGSQVRMCGTTDICVHMYMADDSGGRSMWKKAYMKVLVGSIKHNILSVTSLANSGWRFTQGPAGFDLYHTELNLHCVETAYFSNCPWVRMRPEWFVATCSGDTQAETEQSGLSLCPLTRTQDDLAIHRRQGHVPFDSRCLACARARAVFQRRRKRGTEREVELQADIAYLSQTGEASREEHGRAIRILVLTEMMSGALGFVVISSNADKTKRQVGAWLDHFGLVSQHTAITLHTDAEIGVAELVGRSVGSYSFVIRRAAPQQHHSIGGAERAVRELKESLAALRADLKFKPTIC